MVVCSKNVQKLNSYQNDVHIKHYYGSTESAASTGSNRREDVDVDVEAATEVLVLDSNTDLNGKIGRKRIVWPLMAAMLLVVTYLMSGSNASSSNTAATANLLGAATAKASGSGAPPSSSDMPDWNDPNGRYDWQKCLNADDDGCWKQEGKRVGSFWEDFGQRMKNFWSSVGDWFKTHFGGSDGADGSGATATPSKPKKKKSKKTKVPPAAPTEPTAPATPVAPAAVETTAGGEEPSN